MKVSVQLEGRGTPGSVKLLLDENLSPSVAKTLCSEDGIDACHVRDRAMLGWEDSEVLERAFIEDRIVVTCNVVDFVALARARELHAGIVRTSSSRPGGARRTSTMVSTLGSTTARSKLRKRGVRL